MRKVIALIVLLGFAEICWAQPTPACCGFNVGDRISLLVANPYGATGLPIGTCGTVVCCDPTAPGLDELFVSWDNWTQGFDDQGYCGTPPPAYISGSGWWIDCTQAILDATCAPAAVCGNGICEAGEDALSCPADCAYCCGVVPGDRVSLLVSNPYEATGLLSGARAAPWSAAIRRGRAKTSSLSVGTTGRRATMTRACAPCRPPPIQPARAGGWRAPKLA